MLSVILIVGVISPLYLLLGVKMEKLHKLTSEEANLDETAALLKSLELAASYTMFVVAGLSNHYF